MKLLKLPFIIMIVSCLTACNLTLNPNGSRPNNPYFITTEQIIVKGITVPVGTSLEYKKHFFKKGEQGSIMNEKYLTGFNLPKDKTIDWGDVPINAIHKFFNEDMSGYTVYANFEKVPSSKTTFYTKWKEEGCDLGITVKNRDDWSFNKSNILDIESCSVIYQRYNKYDEKQQDFLDVMYEALMGVRTRN
ncbi:hypothetical protein SAMN04487910_2633 [Aquimarina amphilecti]|uniref:Lipoprotein n=1 Tax=Aquimarina amphilecti TaxID=1038014 RepID=A0A1H7QPE2_AQUAM|nr:hypothetical protein [Aquimarina amphilecti]SEL49608.1 hypothetical protein SAMN04487910_2633 [Aquimarina amphilecti]